MKKDNRLVIGNWKMNPEDIESAKRIFLSIRKQAEKLRRTNVAICPPSVFIRDLCKIKQDVSIGCQNFFYEYSGPYTGEESILMLKNAGAEYAIIGHSERRALGETDEMISKKVSVALKEGVKAVLCVGEGERDDDGNYLEFLKNQIRNALSKTQKKYIDDLIIAYEPVWAIGKKDEDAITGRDMHEMSIFIHKILADMYGAGDTLSIPVLYGGSVSSFNAEGIIKEGEIEGFLVGRQSLDPESFGQVLKIAEEA